MIKINLWRLVQPIMSFASASLLLYFSISTKEAEKYIIIFLLLQIYNFSDFISYFLKRAKKQYVKHFLNTIIFGIVIWIAIIYNFKNYNIQDILIYVSMYVTLSLLYVNHYREIPNNYLRVNIFGILKNLHLIILNWLFFLDIIYISSAALLINILLIIKFKQYIYIKFDLRALPPSIVALLIIANGIIDKFYFLDQLNFSSEIIAYILYFVNIISSVLLFLGYAGFDLIKFSKLPSVKVGTLIFVMLISAINYFSHNYIALYISITIGVTMIAGFTHGEYLSFMVSPNGCIFLIIQGLLIFLIKVICLSLFPNIYSLLFCISLGFFMPFYLIFYYHKRQKNILVTR